MNIIIISVFLAILCAVYFYLKNRNLKNRRFNAFYELSIWQTFLYAKENNAPELFNSEIMINKFMELSKKRYVKNDYHKQALKNTFEKTILAIKENGGIYFSVINKDKSLDFSSIFQ